LKYGGRKNAPSKAEIDLLTAVEKKSLNRDLKKNFGVFRTAEMEVNVKHFYYQVEVH
jgi:hypothetical protein